MPDQEKYPNSTGPNRWIGVLLIIISAASFGALPIFTRLAYRAGADAPTILLLRYSLAAVIMIAITLVRRTPLPRGRILLGLILMGAVYILVGSRIMPHTNAIAASTTVITAAGVVYAGIVAVRGPVFPQTPLGWGVVVAIALVSTVIGIVTFFAGLERIGPTRASTLSTFEPAVSVMLAILVLGETISPLQVLGGILILAAVIVCSVT